MTTQSVTREAAIDAAGRALAEISRELRRTKRTRASRVDPKPQPQPEQQSDAA